MPNDTVEMTNLNAGDTIGFSRVVTVDFDNQQSSDLQVRLTCPGSTVSPASHPAPATSNGTVQFTVSHAAEGDDEQVTVKLTDGTTDFASDAVPEVDVRNQIKILIDKVVAPESGATVPYTTISSSIPNGVYQGTYKPTPGGNRVVLTVQRRRNRRYKTLLVRDVYLIVVQTGGGALEYRWEAFLPGISVANGKVVVRAMLLNHNDRVIQTVSFGS